MPSVRPRSSRPVNWARFHSPRRSDASAAAIRRATPYSSARVCSAAAIVLPVGALTTTIPAARRRLEVDVVDADPGPADDDQPRAGGDQLGVDLDLAADDERVVVGDDRAQLVARQARAAHRPGAAPAGARRPLRRRARRRGPSRTGPDGRPARSTPIDSSAATCAAATAAPADRRDPARARRSRACSIAPRISSSVTEPRWPSRKILPVSLPWPPARTTPRRLTSPLNAFQSRSSGTRAAVTVFDAWAGSANSSNPSAESPARDAAAHAS